MIQIVLVIVRCARNLSPLSRIMTRAPVCSLAPISLVTLVLKHGLPLANKVNNVQNAMYAALQLNTNR
jgi:hypothetical protein